MGPHFEGGLDQCYPMAPRTHILRLLGPKTILYTAFGLFCAIGLYWVYEDSESGAHSGGPEDPS